MMGSRLLKVFDKYFWHPDKVAGDVKEYDAQLGYVQLYLSPDTLGKFLPRLK